MKAKIVGYKKFISKSGKPCCYGSFIVPLTDYEVKNGGLGMNVMKDVFIPESAADSFEPSAIDADCNLEGAWGRDKEGKYVFYVTRVEVL